MDTNTTIVTPPLELNPDTLPDDPVILKRMILELLATLQEERRDKDGLRHRLDLLLRRLYGPRGERSTPTSPCSLARPLGRPIMTRPKHRPPLPNRNSRSRARPARRGNVGDPTVVAACR